jgi:hypothetical protein
MNPDDPNKPPQRVWAARRETCILSDAVDSAKRLLSAKRPNLDRLVRALPERETLEKLEKLELEELLGAAGLQPELNLQANRKSL